LAQFIGQQSLQDAELELFFHEVSPRKHEEIPCFSRHSSCSFVWLYGREKSAVCDRSPYSSARANDDNSCSHGANEGAANSQQPLTYN
jgi:hypothetical protein